MAHFQLQAAFPNYTQVWCIVGHSLYIMLVFSSWRIN
jgi:hypothetical protein